MNKGNKTTYVEVDWCRTHKVIALGICVEGFKSQNKVVTGGGCHTTKIVNSEFWTDISFFCAPTPLIHFLPNTFTVATSLIAFFEWIMLGHGT